MLGFTNPPRAPRWPCEHTELTPRGNNYAGSPEHHDEVEVRLRPGHRKAAIRQLCT